MTAPTEAVPLTGPARPPSVTVIGCDGRPLDGEAAAALRTAALVVGARRHLASVPIPARLRRSELTSLDRALDVICRDEGPVVVLASGDPGFFGIVRALRARGLMPRVIPAVSSVALAFSRLGLDWDDALVLSAHGREPRPVLAAALAHPKVAILTGPAGEQTSRLAAELLAADRRVFAAERLGTAQERLRELGVAASGGVDDVRGPCVLVALADGADDTAPPRWLAGHQGAPPGWALPEEEFEHRDSMITKAEVRAFALAKLGPGPGRTIWDVGAGSGSVAVECAGFGAWVIAVDVDPSQCDRIRRNAVRHRVQLRVVEGPAQQVVRDLPAPDSAFVGGGSDAALAATVEAGRPQRVVVALAAVDRVRAVGELLASHGYRVDGSQLAVSRLAGLPGGSLRLAAANPVFVVWGVAG